MSYRVDERKAFTITATSIGPGYFDARSNASGPVAAVSTVDSVRAIDTVTAVGTVRTCGTLSTISTRRTRGTSRTLRTLRTRRTLRTIDTVRTRSTIDTVHAVDTITAVSTVGTSSTIDTVHAIDAITAEFGAGYFGCQLDYMGALALAEGFDVVTTVDGREALTHLRDRPADLVLVDLRMPGVSGLDTLKAIRATHARCQVVLMTGYASIDGAVEAVKLGASDYLTKPFDLARLRRILGAIREETRQRRDVLAIESDLAQRLEFCGMVGRGPAMQDMRSTTAGRSKTRA